MDNEEETHITTEDARAGSIEHVVRYVLAISLSLAIIAMIVVAVLFARH